MKASGWSEVAPDAPCVICTHNSWCSISDDGKFAICRRLDTGQCKQKTDKNGADYWVYSLKGHVVPALTIINGESDGIEAPVDLRLWDKVYRQLLASTKLDQHDRNALHSRGLCNQQIENLQYRTVPRVRKRILDKLYQEHDSKLLEIPGFWKTGRSLRLAAPPNALLIPVWDSLGRVAAIQVKPRDQESGPKYFFLSSKKQGGASPGAPVNFPPNVSHEGSAVRVTEGILKSQVATSIGELPTIGLPGISGWKKIVQPLREFGVTTIVLAFDSDAAHNPHVAKALHRTAEGLSTAGFAVDLEVWQEQDGKGIDDVLHNGNTPNRLHGESAGNELADIIEKASGPSLLTQIEEFSRDRDEDWPTLRCRLEESGIIAEIAMDRGSTRHHVNTLKKGLDLLDSEVKDLRDTISQARAENKSENTSQQRTNDEAVAQLLIQIADKATLFHDKTRTPFAEIAIGDHREVHPIEGREFEEHLSSCLWRLQGIAASSSALTAAKRVICSKAKFDGECIDVHVRIHRDEDTVYYDVGDDNWNVISIDKKGWRILRESPVLFRRHSKSVKQTTPMRGGNVDHLRKFFHLSSTDDWTLLFSWLIAGLIPGTPRPALVIKGEQGTAKSTTARVIRRLIDPSASEVCAPPENEREFVQSISHGWLSVFDNVAAIKAWLSNALCRAITGGAFEKRKLFTDDEDIVIEFRRLILLNGIGDIVTQPDIIDRSIIITLRHFLPGERKTENEFWADFEKQHSHLFGALLDITAKTLFHLPNATAPEGYRMADFAHIGVAVEKAMAWPRGQFTRALKSNAEQQVEDSLEASAVATAVMSLLKLTPSWEGTASDLLSILTNHTSYDCSHSPDWPKRANDLGSELSRVSPSLRKMGIEIQRYRRGHTGQRITSIRRIIEVPPSPTVRVRCRPRKARRRTR